MNPDSSQKTMWAPSRAAFFFYPRPLPAFPFFDLFLIALEGPPFRLLATEAQIMFFYKMLCDRAEVRLCKAPSCGVCSDYSLCFASE